MLLLLLQDTSREQAFHRGLVRWEPGEGDSPAMSRFMLQPAHDAVLRARIKAMLRSDGVRPCSHRGLHDMRPLHGSAAVHRASDVQHAHAPAASALVSNGSTTVCVGPHVAYVCACNCASSVWCILQATERTAQVCRQLESVKGCTALL